MNDFVYQKRGWVYWLVMGVCLVSLSGGLVFTSLLASQMRLSGDDYCYNSVLAQYGFWGMQVQSYQNVSMYCGGRYALNLFSGLFGLFPIAGTPVLLIGGLILWVVGLFVILLEVSKSIQRSLRKLDAFILAEAIVCFVLWSTPNLDQSFFWRSGMLTYFMPMICMTWMISFILRLGRRENLVWYQSVLLFLSSVFIGGFSETGTALQLGVWGLGLIAALVAHFSGNKRALHWVKILVVPVAGALAAFGLLYFAPSTSLRWETMPERLSIGSLLSMLALNLKVYFWQAVMRRTVYLVLPILFGFGFYLFFAPAAPTAQNWKKMLLQLLGLGVGTVVLVGCVFLPATYVYADYPPDRALLLSQAVLILAELGFGMWLAELARGLFWVRVNRNQNKLAQVLLSCVVFLTLFSVLVVPVVLTRTAISEWPFVHKWSSYWEARHQDLVEAGLANESSVHVIELDNLITDVTELTPDPGFWYNNCAEMYYEIDAIYADQPGW